MTESIQTAIYSPETERAMLACLILDPALLDHVALDDYDFYIRKNAMVYSAMKDLHNADKPIDYVTLCGQLDSKGLLKEIGGPAYIMHLTAAEGWTYNAKGYADEIREKSRRRKLLEVANVFAQAIYDQTKKLDDVIPGIINAIVESSSPSDGAVHFSNYLSRLYDDVMERSKSPNETWGIPTGYPKLDRLTGGVQVSESMIVSGNAGVGKSMWTMQAAAQMAKSAPGVIYSLEMKGVAVARRLMSWKSGIHSRDLKTGKVDDWAALTYALEELEKLPVYMSDASGWTTTTLRADLARLKAQHGIKWFVLDYLYLLNDLSGENEINRTTSISNNIKRICRALDLGGITIHSQNKEGGDNGEDCKAPVNGSLRGSGQVGYDADVILFLTKYKKIDKLSVMQKDIDNVRLLWVNKGRELEDNDKVIAFVKKPDYPAFAEYPIVP